jgi:hypothetical protein
MVCILFKFAQAGPGKRELLTKVVADPGSGFTEYQPGGRVEIDVTNRDPFRLDTVQSPVCPETPVTPETEIFL